MEPFPSGRGRSSRWPRPTELQELLGLSLTEYIKCDKFHIAGEDWRAKEGTPIPRWKVGGFVIIQYPADHPPLHVHVLKDGTMIGRYDLENGRWMEGPSHAEAQANRAIRQWRSANLK